MWLWSLEAVIRVLVFPAAVSERDVKQVTMTLVALITWAVMGRDLPPFYSRIYFFVRLPAVRAHLAAAIKLGSADRGVRLAYSGPSGD